MTEERTSTTCVLGIYPITLSSLFCVEKDYCWMTNKFLLLAPTEILGLGQACGPLALRLVSCSKKKRVFKLIICKIIHST